MAQYEKLEDNRIKLTVTVPADKFEEALNKAYIKEGKHFAVQGFRKGKAPRKMIEKVYGEGAFYEAAFDEAYYPAFLAAIANEKLEPVDRPDIDIVQIGHGQDLIFDVTFPVAPEITLTPDLYKGVELKTYTYEASDAEVEMRLKSELDKNARYVSVERPVENGDRIDLNYAGTVNGVAFEGGTAENQTLDIGSHMFIPGFEEQLIGASAGEERDVLVTFPEQYHAKDLAGKPAVFHCKVNEVKEKQLPEADDEFAKDVSEFDTLEEYKADIKAKINADAAAREKVRLENEAVKAVADKVEVSIPEGMINRQLDYMINDLAQQMSYQGLQIDQYMKAMGMTMEQLRENYKPLAEQRVKGDLILQAIIKAENIVVDDDAVNKEIQDYADAISMDVEKVKESLRESDLENLRAELASQNAMRLIVENAVITEAPVEAPQEKAEDSAAEEAAAETEAPKAE